MSVFAVCHFFWIDSGDALIVVVPGAKSRELTQPRILMCQAKSFEECCEDEIGPYATNKCSRMMVRIAFQ